MKSPAYRHRPLPAPLRNLLAAALVTACAGLMASTAPAEEAEPEARLVKLLISYRQHDPFFPWKTSAPSERAGYGIQIDSKHILTTEHLVRNATLVEFHRPRSADKTPVAILRSDPQLNLCLLRLPTVPGARSLPDIRLDPAVILGQQYTIIQMDPVRERENSPAIVKQASVTGLGDSPHSLLLYHMLSSLNVNGEGAPVYGPRGLVGLVAGFNQRSRIASVIAAPFIAGFIQDAIMPPYRGIPTAGFIWSGLTDPVKRRYLALPEATQGGILVLGTLPFTGADAAFRPLDVILSWDGRDIDSLGFYRDEALGRTEISHLIRGNRKPGETVRVRVLREGRLMDVSLTLSGDMDDVLLVPQNVTGERAEYLVSGGLILRELDAAYLRGHGSDWRAKADSRLMNLYLNGRDKQQSRDDRVVILSAVLPDDINISYQAFRNRIVTAVNGVPVHNMADVFSTLDRDGLVHRITLNSVGFDLVLDREQLPEANRRIAARYRITEAEYRR